MKIYLAADHAGLDLKNALALHIQSLSTAGVPYEVQDCGAFEFDAADDYPDFIGRAAELLSQDLAQGIVSRAIVIGASGQGEAMVANKFRGVRCALYYGEPPVKQKDMSGHELDMIASTRMHNDSNALSLGARFLTQDAAKAVVQTWLTTAFSGEDRHARRIKKLDGLGA